MFNLRPKTSITEQKKKEQTGVKLFSGKYYKGLRLWAFNEVKKEVYEVEIIEGDVVDFETKKATKNRKATINKNHPHVWAFDEENAHRKIKNLLKKLLNS